MAPRGLQLLKGDPRSAVGDIRLMMLELDGLQVIRSLRALRPQPYTCVVVLTAKDRLEDILQGLSAGAEDYLIKPFPAEELQARLLVGQRILDLQHRLMAALEIAEFRGTHDALTGVCNPAAIVEVLAIQIVGEFLNSKNLLRPGQYARIQAPTRNITGALLVPQAAVNQQQGTYQVTVVDADNRAQLRTVEVGPR